jgi:hypothetical protein
MKPNWHYYEAHITIKDTENKQELLDLLKDVGIKVVDLVNIPLDGLLNEEGIITTMHGTTLSMLQLNVRLAVKTLQKYNYQVLRYKIESTVIDSKHDDVMNLL